MNVLDIMTFAAALATFVAYLCRLDGLRYGRHRLGIIVLHMAGAVSCAGAAKNAWVGQSGVLEVAVVFFALAWIVVSFKTWQNGVPKHFDTRPAELEPLQLNELERR